MSNMKNLHFNTLLSEIKKAPIHNADELNFILTEIVNSYKEKAYEDYRLVIDVIGALEHTKMKFFNLVSKDNYL